MWERRQRHRYEGGRSGIVTGANAISMARTAANRYEYASVTLDKSGTITGPSDAALIATISNTSFAVTNRLNGVIDRISGAFSKIEKDRLVEGGSGIAINGTGYSTQLINSGQIAAAEMVLLLRAEAKRS